MGGKRYNDARRPPVRPADPASFYSARRPRPRASRTPHAPPTGRDQHQPNAERSYDYAFTRPQHTAPSNRSHPHVRVVSPASPPHATRRVPGTGIQRLTLFGLTFGDRADEPDKRFVHYRSAIWARGGSTTTAGEDQRSNRKRGARARGAEGRRGA